MFTSEPSLAQRIERMISDVPIVDTRADLDPHQLGAPDLAALIAELPVRLALQGVGMPSDVLDSRRSVAERVDGVVPWLSQVRTTAAGWCLFRIFRDLYDFDEPQLTSANSAALMDRVARAANDPTWAPTVIEQRAQVQMLVTTAPTEATAPATEPAFLRYRLEIRPKADVHEPIESIRAQVFAQLDQQIEGRVGFVSFAEPPVLEDPVHAAVLQWHQLHESPVQVLLDQVYPSAALEPMHQAIRQYPRARFALMTGRSELAPAGALLAARFANVFTESYAGHGAWPASIGTHVLARIESAGISKVGGFASGATSAEWVYGSLQATKKATAAALAQSVAAGFFEEAELPPLLKNLFADSAVHWYQLAASTTGRPTHRRDRL